MDHFKLKANFPSFGNFFLFFPFETCLSSDSSSLNKTNAHLILLRRDVYDWDKTSQQHKFTLIFFWTVCIWNDRKSRRATTTRRRSTAVKTKNRCTCTVIKQAFTWRSKRRTISVCFCINSRAIALWSNPRASEAN